MTIDKSKDHIKDQLTAAAQQLVMDEAVGKIVKRVHADGSINKIKKGRTAGQKAKNSGGRSAGQRHRSAIKTLRTKRKTFGKAISNKSAKKIKRANMKRKARHLKDSPGA